RAQHRPAAPRDRDGAQAARDGGRLAPGGDGIRVEAALASAARGSGSARHGVRGGRRNRRDGEVAAPPRSRALTVHGSLELVKQAAQKFLADDCMGLAQQIAYSSLLAFFPAVIFLVGLLGLIGAYDQLQSFLSPVAPGNVIDIVKQLQRDSHGGGSAAAVVFGAVGALWAA